MGALSKKPPLQAFEENKWWEYVTNVMGMSPSEYVIERKQFDMKNVDGDNLRADLHRK